MERSWRQVLVSEAALKRDEVFWNVLARIRRNGENVLFQSTLKGQLFLERVRKQLLSPCGILAAQIVDVNDQPATVVNNHLLYQFRVLALILLAKVMEDTISKKGLLLLCLIFTLTPSSRKSKYSLWMSRRR